MTELKYLNLYNQAKSLIMSDVDEVANMANLSALLMTELNLHWVGFYRVKGKRLVVGPFQGPVACMTIEFGKGVCGCSWAQKETIIVPNVHEFHGHIACSPLSNSEIVIPCFRGDEVFAVLDLDSTEFDKFGKLDKQYLEKIVALL